MTRTPSRQDHIRPSFFEKYRLPLITLLISTAYFTTVYAAGWMTGIYAPTGGWGVWNPSKLQTDPPDITVTTTGSVGIGVASPGAKLEIAGQVKITGGSPGSGKVLVSDASGLASWQSSSSILGGGPSDCSMQTQTINGRRYMLPTMSNGGSYTGYYIDPIDNGNYLYYQKFSCNSGVVTQTGSEVTQSTYCSSNYIWDGTKCSPTSGIPLIAYAFSGTNCNTGSISVVILYPGTDTIPPNPPPNTLYYLQTGEFFVNSTIVQMNNCNAIVGSGKDKTIIRGTVNYPISILSKKNFSVKDVSFSSNSYSYLNIAGSSSGIIANVNFEKGPGSIVISNSSGVLIQDSMFDGIDYPHSGNNVISMSNSNYNTLSNITIKNYRAVGGYSRAIILGGSYNTLSNVNISNLQFQTNWAGALIAVEGILVNGPYNTIKNTTIRNLSHQGSNEDSETKGIFIDTSANNTTISNVEISNLSDLTLPGGYPTKTYGVHIKSNNNTLSQLKISGLFTNTGSSYAQSNGIYSYQNGANTISNVDIYNINGYYTNGVSLTYSNQNTLNNLKIVNVGAPSGLNLYSSFNNAISNTVLSNASWGLYMAGSTGSILRNIVSYNSTDGGMSLGNNSPVQQGIASIYSYNNTGPGFYSGTNITTKYYDALKVFGNIGGNSIGNFIAGSSSDWTNGFGNGVYDTSGTFSTNWVVQPTNVPGWNFNTRGYQGGLTWPDNVTWSYGSSLPNQVAPVIASGCNISTQPCALTFGDTSTYNSLKKVGEW